MSDAETAASGVWAVLDRDYYEAITAVYPTEVEALRAINSRGYGRVAFVGWGKCADGSDI